MKIKNQRKYRIIAAAVFSGIVLVFLTVFFMVRGGAEDKAAPDTVVVWSLFFNEVQKPVVDNEFGNFSDRFSRWSVSHQAKPYREIRRDFIENRSADTLPDILTVINPAEFADTVFHSPPKPWSGNFWVFYYSKDHLTPLLGKEPRAPSGYEELMELFEQAAAAGMMPLSLGAAYGWPLTALVQHLAGSIASPESGGSLALDIAREKAAPDDPRLAPVYEELRRWRRLGWISSSAAELPWTAGVNDVITGKAAFTLLNQQFFDSVPAEKRSVVDFFPFPAEWAIGNIIYLARPSARTDRPAVREFEQFLLSSGVVDRLENTLSVPFFGGVRDTALPGQIIPSVTGNPSGPYHRGLWNAALDAIR